MDVCVGCDRLWLDYGELKQIADAPGTDRGSRDPSSCRTYPKRCFRLDAEATV
jgi:Zn-finger nucleic acid-binding protein